MDLHYLSFLFGSILVCRTGVSSCSRKSSLLTVYVWFNNWLIKAGFLTEVKIC